MFEVQSIALKFYLTAISNTCKSLLQKVFGKLVYTSKGLEAFFIYEDGSEIVNKKFQEPEGKLLKFENRNQSKPLLSGAESDLTLSFQNSQVVGIGWANPTTCKKLISVDFIEFFQKSNSNIIEIIGPLYRKGLSVTDIAEQTGLKRTSIWRCLKDNKQILLKQSAVPYKRWRQGHGKRGAKPPYGFCYFEGEVIKDPKEYPTLQLIQNLWKQGASISSIITKLEERKLRSRMNKAWSYNVIKSIIKRSKDGVTEHLVLNKNSKNKKQNSTEVEDEL